MRFLISLGNIVHFKTRKQNLYAGFTEINDVSDFKTIEVSDNFHDHKEKKIS